MEKENHSQKLNFIDATIINTSVGQYEFKYIANMQSQMSK